MGREDGWEDGKDGPANPHLSKTGLMLDDHVLCISPGRFSSSGRFSSKRFLQGVKPHSRSQPNVEDFLFGSTNMTENTAHIAPRSYGVGQSSLTSLTSERHNKSQIGKEFPHTPTWHSNSADSLSRPIPYRVAILTFTANCLEKASQAIIKYPHRFSVWW